MSRVPDVSREDLLEELATAFYAAANSREYSSPPVKHDDDVVLLSYGFKFGSNGAVSMWRNDSDGTRWRVDMTGTYPHFYRNDSALGSISYDDMVAMFSPPKREVA